MKCESKEVEIQDKMKAEGQKNVWIFYYSYINKNPVNEKKRMK